MSLQSRVWIMELFFPFVIACLLGVVGSTAVSDHWCTRMTKETEVRSYIEYTKCNQSYTAYCSWFDNEICTFYELVDCPKMRNKTVNIYRSVESCCPGYKLDPINNITCIVDKDSDGKANKMKVTGVTLTPYILVTSPDKSDAALSVSESEQIESDSREITSTATAMEENKSDNSSREHIQLNHFRSQQSQGNAKNLFLGLSHGAYAGIICAMLFIICVTILIFIHLRKKYKKREKEDPAKSAVSFEASEKLVTMPQQA